MFLLLHCNSGSQIYLGYKHHKWECSPSPAFPLFSEIHYPYKMQRANRSDRGEFLKSMLTGEQHTQEGVRLHLSR